VYSHDKHLIKRHFGMRYGYATTRGSREKIVLREEWGRRDYGRGETNPDSFRFVGLWSRGAGGVDGGM